MASRLSKIMAWARQHGGPFALQILVNAVLPLLIYNWADKPYGDVDALLMSSGPPILWSIVEFIRHRKVDAISAVVLAGIVLSLLAFFGGGGPKFLQLRETLVGAVIGLAFVVSVIIRRPIIYYFARANMQRANDAEGVQRFEELRDNPYFRRVMTVMTLVWGLGLIAHTTVNCILVFQVSIPTYLAISPIIGYSFTGALVGFTFLYARRAQRLGDARRAAAAAAAEQAQTEATQPPLSPAKAGA